MSLFNAFNTFRMLNFAVGALALFTVILTVKLIISSTVIIVRTMRCRVHCGGLPPGSTAITTVRGIRDPIVKITVMLTTMFIPITFLNKVVNVLCGRFTLAVTISILVSTFITLSLAPTLYTKVLHRRGRNTRQKQLRGF